MPTGKLFTAETPGNEAEPASVERSLRIDASVDRTLVEDAELLARLALDAGLRSAKTKPLVDLGDFTQYLDDNGIVP